MPKDSWGLWLWVDDGFCKFMVLDSRLLVYVAFICRLVPRYVLLVSRLAVHVALIRYDQVHSRLLGLWRACT